MLLLSTLCTYLLLFLIFVAVIALAVFLGITLRKKKNAKTSQGAGDDTAGEV